MWQVLLAAVVAGSTSLVAKHFFDSIFQDNPKRNDAVCHDRRDGTSSILEEETTCRNQEPRDPEIHTGFLECGYESKGDKFSFPSTGSSVKGGSRSGGKISMRKSRIKDRGLKKKDGIGAAAVQRKSRGCVDVKRRRFNVCLKKQRSSKLTNAKSRVCSSRDNVMFDLGLGVGIMCTMPVWKGEINKLNVATDEAAKVVQELKEELQKRKPQSNQVLGSFHEVDSNSKKHAEKNNHLLGAPLSNNGEYASIVLTDELETNIMKMDRLQAELEFELEKLSWCSTESSSHKGTEPNQRKAGDSTIVSKNMADKSIESYQCNGVSPQLLDEKLCHLLIEQQENQIEALESKLQQKDFELQALKECVKRITEFSFSSNSSDDDEVELNQHDGFLTNAWIHQSSADLEQRT